jgi:hypothetical protein
VLPCGAESLLGAHLVPPAKVYGCRSLSSGYAAAHTSGRVRAGCVCTAGTQLLFTCGLPCASNLSASHSA